MTAIPMPGPGLLRRLCAAFLDDPSSADSIDLWARRFGTTRRTLARAFRRELGTTFARWRCAARVALAIERLNAGATVTNVAFDLGYASHSAFTAMFRRATGRRPSDLARRAGASADGGIGGAG
jgi:AraC-like DNA-binding protein